MEGWILLPMRLVAVGLVAFCFWHSMTLTQPLVFVSPESAEFANQPVEPVTAQRSVDNWLPIIVAGMSAAVVSLLAWQQKRTMVRRLHVIAAMIHQLGGAYVTRRSDEQVTWSNALRTAYEMLFGVCDRIISVDLSNTNVTDDDLFFLVKLASLTSLNLSRTAITPDFIEQIATLGKLQHLSLAGTSIGDDACAKIAKLSQLRRLELSNTDVSHDGLTQLAGLRHLSILAINGTRAGAF